VCVFLHFSPPSYPLELSLSLFPTCNWFIYSPVMTSAILGVGGALAPGRAPKLKPPQNHPYIHIYMLYCPVQVTKNRSLRYIRSYTFHGLGPLACADSELTFETMNSLGFWGSISGGGWEFFSSPPRPERLWGPLSLLSNGHHGSFLESKAAGE
jgi:hypothetical protein